MRNKSVLDRVKEQAASLSRPRQFRRQVQARRVSHQRARVEKRIERLRGEQDLAHERARERGRLVITMQRPDNGLPEDIRDHMRLMCDIVALAFQTDKTRIATLLLCRDISGLFYPFLDVRKAHHPGSHRRSFRRMGERVSRYYCSQIAYLAQRLDAMPEGDGSVLDHSCLLFINNMWSGSKHDSTKVPLLTVGGLGGTLETGRVLDYVNQGDENRKLCSLYLAIMNRMGLPAKRFGDADTPLARL